MSKYVSDWSGNLKENSFGVPTSWTIHFYFIKTYAFPYDLHIKYIMTVVRRNITHSWNCALLEKLPIVQLLKNFSAFYGTRRFNTVFTRALNLSLSWARSIQSIQSYPISLTSILILSTHLIKEHRHHLLAFYDIMKLLLKIYYNFFYPDWKKFGSAFIIFTLIGVIYIFVTEQKVCGIVVAWRDNHVVNIYNTVTCRGVHVTAIVEF
jgi:hypothetical protein